MSNSILLNDSKVKRFVIVVSVLIPAVVTLLYFIPQPENLSEETKQQLYILPKLNAIFNGMAFFALIGALIAIKTKNIQLHKALTTTAMVLSVLFLVSYVIFHLTTPSTPFGGEGTIKAIYLFILLTHILLSAIIVPLVLFTYIFGLSMQVERHRKWAKITFPLWLYVTLTGPVVYMMISEYYPY